MLARATDARGLQHEAAGEHAIEPDSKRARRLRMSWLNFELRKQGYTQTALAKHLGISYATICNVLHGRVTSRFVAHHVAELIGHSVETIWPGLYDVRSRARSNTSGRRVTLQKRRAENKRKMDAAWREPNVKGCPLDPLAAVNRIRHDLKQEIVNWTTAQRMSQCELAAALQIPESSLVKLTSLDHSDFSVDALLTMLSRIGKDVRLVTR